MSSVSVEAALARGTPRQVEIVRSLMADEVKFPLGGGVSWAEMHGALARSDGAISLVLYADGRHEGCDENPETCVGPDAVIDPDLGLTTVEEQMRVAIARLQPGVPSGQPRQGRNEPCSCGSGKKFKRCCET